MKTLLIFLFLLGSNYAHAFDFVEESELPSLSLLAKEGHGGKSVVCRTEGERKIVSTELQDFFESRVIWGREVSSLDPSKTEMEHARTLLQSYNLLMTEPGFVIVGRYWEEFRRLISKVRYIEGGRLKPIPDSLEVTLPKNCKLEQAAIYVDRNLILIDNEIWEAMNLTDRVGLLLHEYIYYSLRRHGEKDSRRTRKFLGRLFSGNSLVPVWDGFSQKDWVCSAYVEEERRKKFNNDFMIDFRERVNEDKSRTLSFGKIFGQKVLSKKSIRLPRYVFEDLRHPTDGESRIYFEASLDSKFEGGDTLVFESKFLDGKYQGYQIGYRNADREINVEPRDLKTSCFSFGKDPIPSPIDPPKDPLFPPRR